MCRWLAAVCLWTALAAPDGFLGAEGCAECHPSQSERQRGTSHATALRPILGSPLGEKLLGQGSLRERDYRFEYATRNRGIEVRIGGPNEQASMLLEWAFGSGVQAYTAVGRSSEGWVEHRISFYQAPARLGLTPGHFGRSVVTAADALGVPQQPADLARCFGCHSTGSNTGGGTSDVRITELGVRCERCHGPGEAHAAAARINDFEQARKTILNPAHYTAEASVFVCGQCHRTPPPERRQAAPELEDPLSVRFQPVGLIASRCFSASKKLSCITCHDPHENAQRDTPEVYVKACLGCHTKASGRHIVDCRRAKRENCLPCHMRRSSPAPYLTFTDHRIRTYPSASNR